jgi:hypothetical protein
VSAPLVLGENHELGPVTVATRMRQGCSIAGLDVSGYVASEAKKQTARLQRTIQAELPRLAPLLRRGWKQHEVELAAGLCWQVRPQRIAQQRPRIEAGVLTTRIAVFGALSMDPCGQTEEVAHSGTASTVAAEIPAPELVSELPPNSSFRLLFPWSYAKLSDALSEQASVLEPIEGTRVTKVELNPRDGDPPELAVALDVTGSTCGRAWLSASPRYRKDSWSLGFAEPTLMPEQRGTAAAAPLQRWAARLEIAGPAEARSELARSRAALDDLTKMLSTLSGLARPARVQAHIGSLAQPSARVGPDALGVIAELDATASVQLR